MRHFICTIILLLAGSLPAQAGLEVFACEPEWAALVGELAGEHAEVFSAVSAFQDVHHIQARPSLIARVRRADLVICTGADLESGWLPVLLKRAGNSSVLPGTAGYFLASDHVRLLAVPRQLDRAQGDVHPDGNPHIHLDPHNYIPIASALSERLVDLDGQRRDIYTARLADFIQRWETAMADWEKRALPLKNTPVAVYHDAWLYLNNWLGLEQLATLETKPGIPPTSRHLSALLEQMKHSPARAIIRAPYQDKRAVTWLHEHTGIPVVQLPYTVGGTPQADTLFGLFDTTIELLLGVTN